MSYSRSFEISTNIFHNDGVKESWFREIDVSRFLFSSIIFLIIEKVNKLNISITLFGDNVIVTPLFKIFEKIRFPTGNQSPICDKIHRYVLIRLIKSSCSNNHMNVRVSIKLSSESMNDRYSARENLIFFGKVIIIICIIELILVVENLRNL